MLVMMGKSQVARSSRPQLGFSLIEVLIAVFILAVGLLGAAALQLQSLKYTQGSQWRSQSNFLAYDIVERIRANRQEVGSYVQAMTADKPSSRNTMAHEDLYQWLDQLASTIPDGDGAITWDSTELVLTVTISGNDQSRVKQSGTDTLTATTFTYSTKLDPL